MKGQSTDGKDQYLNFYCQYGKANKVTKDCGSNNLKDDAAASQTLA
jgi:hypothetical protein